jgi:hypothetical protein
MTAMFNLLAACLSGLSRFATLLEFSSVSSDRTLVKVSITNNLGLIYSQTSSNLSHSLRLNSVSQWTGIFASHP